MGLFKRVYKIGYAISISSTKVRKKAKVPSLRLTGVWLTKRVGLQINDKVQVFAEKGKIAVLKIEKGG